ncbi:copper chaperone PCu(A)C [Thermomonas sp.]|jgi:copper(I)-binding protein|uniref:copper chaperone PCu(A)C n=1 Tax=Thermomonas sp. TaxID=1971895 RepID=UPI001AC64DC2|nr:copper chaperone PCu(A)C [Xanthomonadales bacterium]MBN8768451.1 copper chaperone PCu(A)C [Stenotrophomonas sp.]
MRTVTTALLALLLSLPALAADPASVQVQSPWLRATPPGAQVAGGFATLVNPGAQADRLLRVESPEAARVELHETFADGGVMRMRALPDGLAVPAHGQVELKPGSYHLMFIQPRQPLTPGMQVPATLVFERAGAVPVTFQVRALGAR